MARRCTEPGGNIVARMWASRFRSSARALSCLATASLEAGALVALPWQIGKIRL